MARAHARLNQRPTVSIMDILVAIMVLEETRAAQGHISALQFGFHPHNGRLNLDAVSPLSSAFSCRFSSRNISIARAN